jgi:hypothetical protein
MSNNPVAESLKKVLASSYILSLKTAKLSLEC